jgi:hypothetical protein
MLGLEAAAGVAPERAHEQSFGLVVFDIIIALTSAPAIGLAQFGPAAGGVNGAAELGWIHEGFDHFHRMAVARLPVLSEPLQGQPQHARAQIGHRELRQQQKAGVVGHQAQTAAALFFGPTDPLIPMLQVFGRRAENQHGHPLARRIPGDVIKAFAHRAQTAQVMMLTKQLVDRGIWPAVASSTRTSSKSCCWTGSGNRFDLVMPGT